MQKLWFGDIKLFSESYLKKLKEIAGITGVIPDNYQIHVPGYKVSEDVLDRAPFPRGWTEWPAAKRDIEAGGDTDIIYPVYAGIAVQTDDAPILELLEACDKIGMEVRAHAGLWGYSGNVFPERGFVDVFGKTIDDRMSPFAVPLCPNDDEILAFEAESVTDVMKRYNFPSLNIDHGHFPPLANPHGLIGCACVRCRARASGWGYDFDAMTEGVREFVLRLGRVTAFDLENAYRQAPGYMEALSLLGAKEEVFKWLEFRARVVSAHAKTVSERILELLGKTVPIDSHIMPPSMAYLSGQDIGQWAGSVDYVSPGWGSAVGWEEAAIQNFTTLAKLLAETAGVEEGFALKFLYRIFGYEDVALPGTVEGLKAHEFRSFDVYKKEILLMARALPKGAKILYPFDATRYMEGDMDETAELIASLRPDGIVCFNWGIENTDAELLSIGKCS